MDKECSFRGCTAVGLPRPLFARVHDLPMTLRLCERHLSELSRQPELASSSVERVSEHPRGSTD